MRELASGASLNDDFLKTLWLQRLPSEMQSILSVSSETLENLAKLADKIAEVRTDPFLNVSVMDKSTSSNPALPTNPREDLPNPLYQEAVALRQQVDALSQQFQRFSGWKSRNRSRTRSNFSRNTTRSLEREGSSEICYHSKFGRHAKRCHSPYSGSDVSCLPVPEMFKKLSPEPLQLFAANNSKILTYGSKLLNIDLGLRRKFSWKFLIASVSITIIGADFLENFGLLVDLKRRKLIDSVTALSISGISAETDIISVKLISVHPDDIKKTAVCTPFGLFEFPFLNFGLCGAAQTFQRFMNEFLGELRFCYVYLDDILIASESEEEHKTHVRAIFQKLNEYGLTINVSKCVFGVPEISFLGHLVTKNGTKPLSDKVDPILNYPQPNTIKELRRFLGLLNFFRRFLPRAAHN
ncbi:hypothetical protein TNCT_501881 [Trichonephila clavata]|uniref:Reverse transcriptase domain-containing protein n=1 Tax=Trichonephila clavata TaxID=2740835 RepID=A0A8X6KLF6_TRICU|nr:hypothetical protein TNCT_501881 [Trichonephila clavata]